MNTPTQSDIQNVSDAQSTALEGASVPGCQSERMQRLNRLGMVGALSAASAHEIKNALVPIKTFIDLLLEEKPNSDFAGIVRRELDRINFLLLQMLKLSGPTRPNLVPLDLNTVLSDTLRLISHQAGLKSVSLKTQFKLSPALVMGDANQLAQVFLNLLMNALEAVNQGGTIEVSTQALNGSAHVEAVIQDNGRGITDENMRHLFHPFFTTKEEGAGLGLSIARDIVGAHRGTIRAESQPGKGSSFILLLPKASCPPPGA